MKNRFGVDWTGVKGTHFWKRPFIDRRVFFRHLSSAIGGYFLLPGRPMETVAKAAVTPIGTAKNLIFVLMAGAPSHADTFDLKEGAWTPATFAPASYGDVRWPQGLLPKLAENIKDIALLRSVRSWALVHGLAQSWVQIGRNPTSALARIAPHIGSVVSRELGPTNSNKTLPAFMSLNTGGGPAQGYFAPEHAPFFVNPNGGGLGNTTHPAGASVLDRRYGLLLDLDAETRAMAEIGPAIDEMEQFNLSARQMMYNAELDRIFIFDQNERNRYGNSAFGNACITARNLLRAKMGTRFIQITIGGWDNHNNIYTTALNPSNANSTARQFDAGLGTLISDLRAEGLLDETLIVALGEFGRTVGPLNNTAGRDHFLTQSILMAGAKIKGGRAIGSTDSIGRDIVEPGWKEQREIRFEDVEATIYSALGIDWTKVLYDDPLGRGFYYVPSTDALTYYPITELW